MNGLRVAMQTRAVIEQAKAMVMMSTGLDEAAAFQFLVGCSQREHTKLVVVASKVVTEGRLTGSLDTRLVAWAKSVAAAAADGGGGG